MWLKGYEEMFSDIDIRTGKFQGISVSELIMSFGETFWKW